MRGKITLNYDGKGVFLVIEPPDAEVGENLYLSTTYRTPQIAAAMAEIMARRMGLRRRGSGWHRRTR